jgi:non-heme chloroperoxidase
MRNALEQDITSSLYSLAAIDAFQGPDAIAFFKGFSDQFPTDDAEESAKETFYHEGLKLPRPYLAKLFAGPPSVIGGVRMAWSRCPPW